MSMVDPSIDKLAELADSKYTLVILAAKRAREINKEHVGETLADREVSMAFQEMMSGRLTYKREKE